MGCVIEMAVCKVAAETLPDCWKELNVTAKCKQKE
jgi:hypothetical protein